MIDWYVILLIPITLLIFHMKEFGEHSDSARYIQEPVKVPVYLGTIQLLFRLMTGTFLFIPFYFTLSFGYMAGFVLALLGGLVLFLFSTQVEELIGKLAIIENRHSFLKSKFTRKGLIAFYVIILLAASEGLIISTFLAGTFLMKAFGASTTIGMIPILFFSFIFAGMGGISGLRKIGSWLIMLFFMGLSILPLSVFLIYGTKPIYINLYSQISNHQNVWLLLIGGLLFMPVIAGHLMLYIVMSNDMILIKRNNVKLAVRMGSICWSSIPIAVSLIVLYTLTITKGQTVAELFIGIDKHMPVLFVYLLVLVILSSFAIGIGVSLYGIISVILGAYSTKLTVQKGYVISLFLCLIPLVLLKGPSGIFEIVFIFFANLFAALGLSLWIIIKSNIRWGFEWATAIFISVLLGSWVSFAYGWATGIAISFVMSTLAIIFLYYINIRIIQK